MVQVSAMYYQTEGLSEYYVHYILIAVQRETKMLPYRERRGANAGGMVVSRGVEVWGSVCRHYPKP